MPVMAVCKGFPTLPHKGGLAERQRVFRHCPLGQDHPFPLAVPLSVKQYAATTPARPPQPPILFTQPAPPCSPPPTLWTRGVVTRCFLSGECGLLVNSWAAIHSQGESSQDTAASLKHAATRGQRTRIQNNRSGFNKRLHFNDTEQPETTALHFICTVLNSPLLPYVSPLFMYLYRIYLSPKLNLTCSVFP